MLARPAAAARRACVLPALGRILEERLGQEAANSALGAAGGDDAQFQVLLRLRVEGCHNTASLPAPGAARPNDPAAYKPKTAFDNTPYRFNMTQGGKRMTADDFDAWLKANGYSVGRRVDTAKPAPAAPVAAPAEETPAPSKKKK